MGQLKAVFLDALGTLVALDAPWPALARDLGEDENRVAHAFKIEMAYYRDHAHEARDEGSLAELRERCAALLSAELGRDVEVETMMDAIRFRAFPDAEPALSALGSRGLARVVVSNWDIGLPKVLDRVGLGELVDGVVSSAAVGARKPDPRIFAAALELAGCHAEEAIHVGDTPEEDLEGAVAAGVRALLIDRSGGGDIDSLLEIEARL